MIKQIYKSIISENSRLKNRLLINKLTSIFYRGNVLECNFCGKTFKKFKAKGTWTKRQNAECPYCGSVERGRLLLFYLQNETGIFSEQCSLLHVAPELGLRPIFKSCKTLKYYNVDINPNYADIQMDLMDIQFPDDSFDYIICSHVLGHVPNEGKAIAEMCRVLKPTGMALIMTIIDWKNPQTYESDKVKTDSERLKHYSEHDLLRLHGADFAERLAASGFEVEVVDYISALGKEKNVRFSLGNGDRETIFKCTKMKKGAN
ncbi:type 11 methyltransferase [Bacteroidales bacterium]|nr:type 11 methyltransferase [Bacteroidales bacterium]